MKRILIVEDNVTQCLELSDLLNEFGFETAVAGDGLKALEILSGCEPMVDIILLDLHMPNMNGWQLRDVLKADKRYCNVPVIIMSGNSAAHEVDAKAHFSKPLDVFALIDSIKTLQ